jgi:hypothetical protein
MISMVVAEDSDEPIRKLLSKLYPEVRFGETDKSMLGEYRSDDADVV